jgi:hypothetical protein
VTARPLALILEELVERKVYPDELSNGRAFIGTHKPSPDPLFPGTLGNVFTWHYTPRNDDVYQGTSERDFAEALGKELDEDGDLALWRVAVAMHWCAGNARDESYEDFRQAVVDGLPEAIGDDTLIQLLRAGSAPLSRWQALVTRQISAQPWQRAAAFTRLVCTEANEPDIAIDCGDDPGIHLWSLAVSVIWRAALPDLPNEAALAAAIRSRQWPGDPAILIDAGLRAKSDGTLSGPAARIVRTFLPSDELHAQLTLATRSLLSPWEAPHSELEYVLKLLHFHLHQPQDGKREAYRHPWPPELTKDIPLRRDKELHPAVRLLQHVQGCVVHRFGVEAESHRIRAVDAAHHSGSWLQAVAPWIIRAFGKANEEAIVDIMSEVATDGMLDRIAELSHDTATESLKTSGCVADVILRRCGRVANTPDPADLRDLLGPFEPIRGQTWLNDQRIEHILYDAVRIAEAAFSRYYTDGWREHEDYLLRDLLDDRVRPLLAQAVRAANLVTSRPSDCWGLHWSKLQPTEERRVGADLALVVEIRAPRRIELRRVSFLQVKAMRRVRGRFSSGWRIDRQQLGDLRAATDSSFYLLLTPQVVSNQQRIVRADTLNGILEATAKKEALSDSHVGPHAHSFAQFLVYDLLGAWQGTEQRQVLHWLETREGVVPRYVLTVRLTRGEGANIEIGD